MIRDRTLYKLENGICEEMTSLFDQSAELNEI